MKERKLLYAIGWVRDDYLLEMNEVPARRRKSHVWLIAAVIAALLLAGCAAVVLLKLEDTALSEQIVTDDMTGASMPRTTVSLQGFAGSPNYEAAKEWQEFLKTYDPDDEILHSLSNEELDQGPEYYSYNCYSPEMARKIDEICEKYGLQTMGEPQHEQLWENFSRVLGIDDLLHEGEVMTVNREGAGGYIFRSGTFHMEFEVTLAGTDQPLFFEIHAVAKTDFDGVFRNIDQLDTYTQWTHTAPDGKDLLLAYNDYSALIIGDRDTYFITITLHNRNFDWENMKDEAYLKGNDWVDQEKWSAIADLFDYSFQLNPLSDADWEYLETHKKVYERQPLGYIPDSSFDDRVRWHLSDKPHPDRLQYAFMDIDEDGREELLIGQDDRICHIYTTDGTNVYNRPFFTFMNTEVPVKSTDYDEPQITISPTYIQICEGKKVLYVFEYTDGTTIYGIAEPSENFIDFTTGYEVDTQNHTYSRLDEIRFGPDKQTPVTEAEFQAAMDALVPIEVELHPLSEYPLT